MDDFLRTNTGNDVKAKEKEKEKVRINVGFSAEDHRAIERYAEEEGIRMMQAIRRVISAGVKEVC
jgi:predicted DNA binding CopG/RHH family protein